MRLTPFHCPEAGFWHDRICEYIRVRLDERLEHYVKSRAAASNCARSSSRSALGRDSSLKGGPNICIFRAEGFDRTALRLVVW